MAKKSQPEQSQKEKSSKQCSEPSSLVHYTSLEVLHYLLQGAIEGGMITLHLSHQRMMNDPYEGELFINSFIERYLKNDGDKDNWEKYRRKHTCFVFSTIRSTRESMYDGNQLMWKMYGDDFRGALIKFNYQKLQKFVKKCNQTKGYTSIVLEQCEYLEISSKQADEVAKICKNDWHTCIKKSAFVKPLFWKGENEFRIVVIADEHVAKTKNTSRGIVMYYELKIPIELISAIIIGPKCDQTITLTSLEHLKNKINEKQQNKANFTISQSRAKIR